MRLVILVLSLRLGIVPLAGCRLDFRKRHDHLRTALGHCRRAVHDTDPSHAFWLLPDECVLGSTRFRTRG